MRGISAQPQGRIVVFQAGSFRFTKSCRLISTPRGRFALDAALIGHARVVWPVWLSERMCAAYPRSLKGKQCFPKPAAFGSRSHIACTPTPEAGFPLRLRG